MASRSVTGVQVHHGVDVGDACRAATSVSAALSAAIAKSGDPRLAELRERADELGRDLGVVERDVRARAVAEREADPGRWRRAFEGDEPFPDERPDGLTPRCRCGDRCLWHEMLGREGVPAAGSICNCSVYCFRHERVRGRDAGR